MLLVKTVHGKYMFCKTHSYIYKKKDAKKFRPLVQLKMESGNLAGTCWSSDPGGIFFVATGLCVSASAIQAEEDRRQ